MQLAAASVYNASKYVVHTAHPVEHTKPVVVILHLIVPAALYSRQCRTRIFQSQWLAAARVLSLRIEPSRCLVQ